MYQRIGVTKKDYDVITEGTPVLVVRAGIGAQAVVMR